MTFFEVSVLVEWTFIKETEISQVSLKTYLFAFRRWTEVLWVWNDIGCATDQLNWNVLGFFFFSFRGELSL